MAAYCWPLHFGIAIKFLLIVGEGNSQRGKHFSGKAVNQEFTVTQPTALTSCPSPVETVMLFPLHDYSWVVYKQFCTSVKA